MSPPGESPLYPLLNEINKAAAGGLPFVAICTAVTLPEICASLASENGRGGKKAYKAWCKDHLGEEFNFLSAEDLYSMRCGILHNGRFGDLKHRVERVIFSLPSGNSFTNCLVNDAYLYGVVEFCRNMTRAVHSWYEKNRLDDNVQRNLPRLMQYHVDGLPPYIVGVTVLA